LSLSFYFSPSLYYYFIIFLLLLFHNRNQTIKEKGKQKRKKRRRKRRRRRVSRVDRHSIISQLTITMALASPARLDASHWQAMPTTALLVKGLDPLWLHRDEAQVNMKALSFKLSLSIVSLSLLSLSLTLSLFGFRRETLEKLSSSLFLSSLPLFSSSLLFPCVSFQLSLYQVSTSVSSLLFYLSLSLPLSLLSSVSLRSLFSPYLFSKGSLSLSLLFSLLSSSLPLFDEGTGAVSIPSRPLSLYLSLVYFSV
jgi:hypothetical protein